MMIDIRAGATACRRLQWPTAGDNWPARPDHRRGEGEEVMDGREPGPQTQRAQVAAQDLINRVRAQANVGVWTVIGPLMRPYRWHLAGAMTLNGIHGLAITCQNVTPKWLLDDVLLPTDLDTGLRLRRALWLAVIYILFSTVGRMLVWHFGYRLFTWVRERMVFALRTTFFRHVNHLCLRFHGDHPSGELFSYLFGSPLGQVVNFYQHVSMHVAGAAFTVVSTVALMGLWDPFITGVLLATALASVLVMNDARRRLRAMHRSFQEIEKDVVGHAADLLRGNRAVKLHALEERISEDFSRDASVIARKSYDLAVQGHVQHMKQETINYFAYGLLIVIGGWRCATGMAEPGVVVAALACFAGLTGPLQFLFTASTTWGAAQASIERIGAVLKTASTTPDPQTSVAAAAPRGIISFTGVTFRYAPDLPPVLHDLNLTIPPGQRLALVGPSGAGKSTIVQLILRLYDPSAGAVTIGGIDLRQVVGADLRRRFGVVPQDPFLFRDTVRENLRVADADASDADLEEACRRANAWEFVAALPQGLDTVVGEGGSSLSGGQRQRLAIARAMLADPDCYVFDEATSSLDTQSERLIQETLERQLTGRTCIFIAHRLATVRSCDRIVVVDSGHLVQDGTYAELVARPGLFRDLVEGQRLLT
jgi:ABC-type multidrug transport system fused ATPase/permease subunit